MSQQDGIVESNSYPLALCSAQQCRMWNADSSHQRKAGQARAAQMTHEERVEAGNASFLAFMVRFRAQVGQAPLPVDGVEQAVAKYLAPSDIHAFGRPLHPQLAETIYRAWCAGHLLNVEAWLSDEHDPPPEPGGLWAPSASSADEDG
jgi:hypothetical protein